MPEERVLINAVGNGKALKVLMAKKCMSGILFKENSGKQSSAQIEVRREWKAEYQSAGYGNSLEGTEDWMEGEGGGTREGGTHCARQKQEGSSDADSLGLGSW